MNLSELKENPKNPRIIKDERFKKLVKSIREFPKMMELRPIVIDADNVVLGGNMRMRAFQELGMTEIPDSWVKRASDLTEEEIKRFIIVDNIPSGEWDDEKLNTEEWEQFDMEELGLEDFSFDDGESNKKPESLEVQPVTKAHLLISCDINNVAALIDIERAAINHGTLEIEKSYN